MNSTASYVETRPGSLSIIISFVAKVPPAKARGVMREAGKVTKSSLLGNLEAAQTNLVAAEDITQTEKVPIPTTKQMGDITPPVIYVPPPPTPVPTPAPTRPIIFTGYSEGPQFVRRANGDNPLNASDVGFRANPAFIDIDDDGDQDLFVGNEQGVITFFENTGTRQHAVYEERAGVANAFDSIDVGSAAAPAFVDIDSDNDFDAFIGNSDGRILYYRNVGNKTDPMFSHVLEASQNPLDIVTAPGHPSYRTAKPTFVVTLLNLPK